MAGAVISPKEVQYLLLAGERSPGFVDSVFPSKNAGSPGFFKLLQKKRYSFFVKLLKMLYSLIAKPSINQNWFKHGRELLKHELFSEGHCL